jgi:hypothetical protein
MLLPILCLGSRIRVLACAALLGLVSSASADPKPLTKEEQDKVDKAIDKGVAYLKRIQREKGDWPLYFKGGYALGQSLLPAYALLESGVPANDPAIKKATEYIRPRVLKLDRTYEVALAILFLDRLGDPNDKPLIRSLGMRLIAGQHVTGGWNYRCPTLGKEQEDSLCKALAGLSKRLEAGEKLGAKLLRGLGVPSSMRNLPVFRSFSDPGSLPWEDPPPSEATEHKMLLTGTTDNSNTQFAMLGLWAAQRYDVPAGPTFYLMVERFERTEQINGWWSYRFIEEQSTPASRRPSMICAGLIGLAIGRGLKSPALDAAGRGAADLRVLKGLAALSQDIGDIYRGLEGVAAPRGAYYLWSVERVATLFDLPTLGGKDWYRWGAGFLSTSQNTGGWWQAADGGGKPLMVLAGIG